MDSTDFLIFNTRPIAGASHTKTGKPCQDFSVSWQSDDRQNLAVIVCDGHGSDTYVRSDVGAKLAAEAALAAIKELTAEDPAWIIGKKGEVTAREIDDLVRYDTTQPDNLSDLPETEQQRYAQRCLFVRQVKDIKDQDADFEKLFQTIYESWFEAIKKDAAENPFSVTEKTALGNQGIVKAYGTTLMAYVQTPLYWFAFHIGDGRILACNRKIEWRQLVPWDTACFQNFTTSLCNTDPVPLFRYAFDATGNFPAAVFCCSDGIEESWGDYEVAPERLHNYYSNLLRVFYNEGKESTVKKLEDFLPLLSEKGSKDDMSLAGYINLKAIANGIKINDLKYRQAELAQEKDIRENKLEQLKKDIANKEAEILNLKKTLSDTEDVNAQADKIADKQIEAIDTEIDELSYTIKNEKAADKADWEEIVIQYLAEYIYAFDNEVDKKTNNNVNKKTDKMDNGKIYIEDYTTGSFYTNPNITDEHKLNCALSALKYLLSNKQIFSEYYYTVTYVAIFYLAYLFIDNYNNPQNGWREKADLYFNIFSVIREPRIEEKMKAIGIDIDKFPKSKFSSSTEDEIAANCVKEFLDKVDFTYIFENKDIAGIFR